MPRRQRALDVRAIESFRAKTPIRCARLGSRLGAEGGGGLRRRPGGCGVVGSRKPGNRSPFCGCPCFDIHMQNTYAQVVSPSCLCTPRAAEPDHAAKCFSAGGHLNSEGIYVRQLGEGSLTSYTSMWRLCCNHRVLAVKNVLQNRH